MGAPVGSGTAGGRWPAPGCWVLGAAPPPEDYWAGSGERGVGLQARGAPCPINTPEIGDVGVASCLVEVVDRKSVV